MTIISLLSLIYDCLDSLMELIKSEWYFKKFDIIGIAEDFRVRCHVSRAKEKTFGNARDYLNSPLEKIWATHYRHIDI